MQPIEFIATCWTSAGPVAPLDADERSPFAIQDRVRVVAETGWAGIGLAQDDLREVRDTIGFAALKDMIAAAGLKYTEVELLTDWWEDGEKRLKSDEVRTLLFQAAAELDATHIKIGTAFGAKLDSYEELVAPLQELSDDAASHGVRLAIEAMPFSMVASVPMAAALIRDVDRANCGLLIDSWHVFRAGTSLDELRASVKPDAVFGVELNDAAADAVGTLFEDTINERKLCGEGSFDLRGLVRAMKNIGYQGPWGVEIISNEFRSLPLKDALASARTSTERVVESALYHVR